MKTNHSTKWKYLLFFGLGSLVVGLSLLAFGAAAGGIEGIKENTKATKEVKTFDNIKNITVNSSYNVTIQSGDVDKVTVTYYSHDKFRPETTLEQEGDTLTFTQTDQGAFVTGFMETGGYLLNEREGSIDYTRTTITVPEDVVLDSLSGSLSDYISSISDIKVKTLDISGISYLGNVSAEGGSISSYSTRIENSQLKNLTFSASGDLDLTNTTLENSTINNFEGYLSTDGATLKEVTINATDATIDTAIEDSEEYDEYEDNYYDDMSYYTYSQLNLTDTTLKNFTFNGSAEVIATNLTLTGDNALTGTLLSANLGLTETSLKTTSLDLATENGDITAPAQVNTNGNASSFSQKLDNATATLTIKSKQGDLRLVK